MSRERGRGTDANFFEGVLKQAERRRKVNALLGGGTTKRGSRHSTESSETLKKKGNVTTKGEPNFTPSKGEDIWGKDRFIGDEKMLQQKKRNFLGKGGPRRP